MNDTPMQLETGAAGRASYQAASQGEPLSAFSKLSDIIFSKLKLSNPKFDADQ